MNKKPFFSVVIPVYNRYNFLKISLSSVLQQSFSDFEVIVVDDGSSCDIYRLIKEIKDERIIYLRNNRQKGVSFSRNQGIKKAKGNFISFLDSDDRFRGDKLEITYHYIKKYPQYKIFHTEEVWYKSGRLLSQKKYHQKPQGDIFSAALKLCCVSISTATIKKEVFSSAGLFDENLRVCEDYDFWLRVSLKYKVFLIPFYLTIKEGGRPDQQSKKTSLDKYRIYALVKLLLENNNLPQEKITLLHQELKRKIKIYSQGAEKRGRKDEANFFRRIPERVFSGEFKKEHLRKILFFS